MERHPVPEEGRYTYRARHAAPGPADPIELLGTLIITDADAAGLEGRFEGPRFRGELASAEWTGEWYEIESTPTYEGRLVHRVAVDEGGGLRCEGYYLLVLESEGEHRSPLECTLVREGAAAPAAVLPSPGSRPVRNATPPAPIR